MDHCWPDDAWCLHVLFGDEQIIQMILIAKLNGVLGAIGIVSVVGVTKQAWATKISPHITPELTFSVIPQEHLKKRDYLWCGEDKKCPLWNSRYWCFAGIIRHYATLGCTF
jgi:hypothetical protein